MCAKSLKRHFLRKHALKIQSHNSGENEKENNCELLNTENILCLVNSQNENDQVLLKTLTDVKTVTLSSSSNKNPNNLDQQYLNILKLLEEPCDKIKTNTPQKRKITKTNTNPSVIPVKVPRCNSNLESPAENLAQNNSASPSISAEKNIPIMSSETSTTNFEELNRIILIQTCNSSLQILEYATEFAADNNRFMCQVCKAFSQGKTGVFKFDILGSRFKVPEENKKKFSALKRHIIDHIKSTTHTDNLLKTKRPLINTSQRLGPHSDSNLSDFQMSTENQKLIKSSKSVNHILQLIPEFQKISSGLLCTKCHTPENKRKSIFKYNFEEHGENFERKKIPSQFSHFKQSIIEHLNTEFHRTGTKKLKISKAIERSKQQNSRIFDAGMNLARNAYANIKRNGSYLNYTMDNAIDMCKKVQGQKLDLGDKNHSSFFSASLTSHFYYVSKSKLKEILDTPLKGTGEKKFFSIIADKATPNSKTLHVIGLVTLTEINVEAYFLNALEVDDNSGKGLAKGIYDTILQYVDKEDVKKRFVSLGVDGQYHHCHVNTHLLDLIGVPDKTVSIEENISMLRFHPVTWDPSHQVELAGKHVRGQTAEDKVIKIPFIRATYNTITEISKTCKWGKGYKKLRELAKALSQEEENTSIDADYYIECDKNRDMNRVKKLRPFSDTRFTTYTFEVLKSFRDNYSHIYAFLHDEKNEKNSLLNQISNASFVLRLSGLLDIYKQIGQTSRKLQTQNMFTWHIETIVKENDTKLKGIARSLNEEDFWPINNDLEYFNNTCNNLYKDGTFMNKPITNNTQTNTKLRSQSINENFLDTKFEDKINNVRKKLAIHASQFNDEFRKLYYESKPAILDLESIIFSINEIRNRGPREIPSEFQTYISICKYCNFFKAPTSSEELVEEYLEFLQIVNQHPFVLINNQVSQADEIAFYLFLLHSETLNCKNLLNLLSAACSRTFAEAITEGFGSIVASKYKGRENLTVEKASQESFIKINCPPPTEKVDALLEQALNRRFEGKPWNVVMKTNPRRLKHKGASKSILKINKQEGKIFFMNSKSSC